VAAGALDVAAVLVFVAIGRSSHQHGVSPAGMASTVWPFLVGLAGGWAVARAWRRPFEVVPVGVIVWLSCVSVGMVLRVVAGQGTAAAFIAVALAFLGLELLGWRALARLRLRLRSPDRRHPGHGRPADVADPGQGH
jgi:FtsH-binding integral membrane protein